MKVNKALITAAAPSQHTIPLQRIVDQNGEEKTALQHIVEEVLSAGIENICVVIQPGDQNEFLRAIGDEVAGMLTFVEQPEPAGYADAVYRGESFVAGDPFLHLVGDHLYLSSTSTSCASQLVEMAVRYQCSVSAVQPTRENKLKYFGTIGGTPSAESTELYDVATVIEKPTPTQAEQELAIAGIRSGFYQCFFGMHVLTGAVMSTLGELIEQNERPGNVSLSDALAVHAMREKYLAFEVNGTRYNIGSKYGVFYAQAALAIQGSDQEEVLSTLVELLASNRLSVSL